MSAQNQRIFRVTIHRGAAGVWTAVVLGMMYVELVKGELVVKLLS